MAEEINVEESRQALERAKAEAVRKDLDPLTLAAAEAAMRWAQVKLRVAALKGHGGPRPHAPESS